MLFVAYLKGFRSSVTCFDSESTMSPRLFINDFFPSNRDLKSILFIVIYPDYLSFSTLNIISQSLSFMWLYKII